MEIIKTSSNVEFNVIYADGTRRHVREGVLHEVEGNEIIFHNGTNQPEVWIASAEDMLKFLQTIGAGLALLSIKMHLTDESREVLRELVWFADDLLNNSSADKQGIFRLGQMDMKQSVVALLQDIAVESMGVTRTTLEFAVEQVKKMEVTRGENS